MDAFSPTRQFNNQKLELLLLDIDDFNGLISILKRREENIIQVLDYNIKYKNSTKEEEINQLELLKNQLKDIEKTRILKEDQIVSKYANLKVTDPRQKKLVIKLVNKLIQLNVSVKDKLTELDIFDKTRDSYYMIPEFEENLKKLINRQIFQVDLILSYIIEKSRLRLEQNINIDINQRRVNIQKLEKILISDHIIFNNPNSIQTIEEQNKDEKEVKPSTTVTIKFKNQSLSPIRQRPYIQKSSSKEQIEESKKDTLIVMENGSNTITIPVESQNPTPVPQKSPQSNQQSLKSPEIKKNKQSLDVPKTSIKKDDPLPDFVKSQSTTQTNLKLTINKSNKTLSNAQAISEETTTSSQNETKFEFKTVRTDPYKHYDILKIENKAPPLMSQKNKKNFMEKVYNELCIWNNEVRRTIFKYRLEYMIFNDKTRKKPTNNTISDISTQNEIRSQSSTPVANISQAPRSISTRQNNHLYSQNLRGRVEQIRCQSSFESSASPFGSNNQPNTTKSRAGQRVLVLPKLNIFEESYYVRPATQSVGTPPSKEGLPRSKQSSTIADPKNKNERQDGNDDMILVQADEPEFISNPSLSIPMVNFTPISRNYSPSFKENPNGSKNTRAFGNILSKINAETFINNQLSKIQGFNLNLEKQRLSDINDKYVSMKGELIGGVLPKTVYHNIRLSTSKTQK